MMTKARSRLQTPAEAPSAPTQNSIQNRYKKYLPLLVLGAASWIGLALVATSISPDQVQNMVVPHLYLPVLLLFALGSFFTLAFVLLHSRRALIGSLLLTTLLCFRLQHIQLSWQLLSIVVIFFGILELSLTMIFTTKKNADIQQKTHQPKRD